METMFIAFIVIVLILILIVCSGITFFASETSVFDRILGAILIIVCSFILIAILYKSEEKIEIQGIEKYLNNEIVRTIDYVNYTEENIPKDTVYTYIEVNE